MCDDSVSRRGFVSRAGALGVTAVAGAAANALIARTARASTSPHATLLDAAPPRARDTPAQVLAAL